jgi:aminoglycoside phosphotransferase (APT) family kinase protein
MHSRHKSQTGQQPCAVSEPQTPCRSRWCWLPDWERPRAARDERPIGIVHGDFQPANILYVNGKPNAVIDWELASIGAQGLDVGWLMMSADERAWPPTCRAIAPVSCTDVAHAGRRSATSIGIKRWHSDAWAPSPVSCIAPASRRIASGKGWRRPFPFLFARGIEVLLDAAKASHGG